MAIALFVIEFVADKIPYVDSVWDAVHTFIRPPAAAFLSYSAFAGGVPEQWKIGAALLAGSVALTSHGAKATTRAAANVSPEPVSNWTLSLAEDSIAVFLSWLAATHPLLTAGLVVVLVILAVLLIWRLFRFFRQIVTRFGAADRGERRRRRSSASSVEPRLATVGRVSPAAPGSCPPTPSPSRRAAEPSRTAISTAPPEPTYASSPPVGTSPNVRRSGPISRSSTSSTAYGRHDLGRQVGDQRAEPVDVDDLADHGLALVVRLGLGEPRRHAR